MLYDMFGRKIDVAFIEKYATLKKKSGSSPWPVIEEAIRDWHKASPKEWEAFLISVQSLRETRKDPKFASTTDKVTGGILRYTLDIPFPVMKIIRAVYNVDELPMNREFFQIFARKFPQFRIAEKT